MLREIEFKKTGNFWIDNGIVGIYKILQKINLEANLNDDYKIINFYDFILNRYTSYRQAQEIMGFGCNLKEALT